MRGIFVFKAFRRKGAKAQRKFEWTGGTAMPNLVPARSVVGWQL
jgi:hypothetical protein